MIIPAQTMKLDISIKTSHAAFRIIYLNKLIGIIWLYRLLYQQIRLLLLKQFNWLNPSILLIYLILIKLLYHQMEHIEKYDYFCSNMEIGHIDQNISCSLFLSSIWINCWYYLTLSSVVSTNTINSAETNKLAKSINTANISYFDQITLSSDGTYRKIRLFLLKQWNWTYRSKHLM